LKLIASLLPPFSFAGTYPPSCIPMSAANGQRLLDRLVEGKVVTPGGMAFLEKALNPFDDFEIKVCGLPDSDTSRVVIQEFNQSVQISAPAGTTGNWDAHIYSLPVCTDTGLLSGSIFQVGGVSHYATGSYSGNTEASFAAVEPNLVFAGTQDARATGILNIDSFATPGSVLAPTTTATYNAPTAITTLDGGYSKTSGRRRLIAAGFEIHDTTAVLSKQGTMTVYRMPQAHATTMAIADADDNNATSGPGAGYSFYTGPGTTPNANTNSLTGVSRPVPISNFNTPPSTIAQAMLYPGTRQWEAREGACVVLTQDPERNKLKFNDEGYFAYPDGDYYPSTMANGQYLRPTNADSWAIPSWHYKQTTYIAGSTSLSSTVTEVMTPAAAHLQLPFHTSGVMITGANLASTFTVTLKTIWEIAPVTGDSAGTLVPLSVPSCPADPVALELYQRAVSMLPPGVIVSMNASGDFWDWCLKALSVAATPIAASLGFAPAGAAAALGINAIRERRNQRDALADRAAQNLAKLDITEFKPRQMPSLPSAVPRPPPRRRQQQQQQPRQQQQRNAPLSRDEGLPLRPRTRSSAIVELTPVAPGRRRRA
jgi:hypothetical protein